MSSSRSVVHALGGLAYTLVQLSDRALRLRQALGRFPDAPSTQGELRGIALAIVYTRSTFSSLDERQRREVVTAARAYAGLLRRSRAQFSGAMAA